MRYNINSSSISFVYTFPNPPPPHMDGNVNFLCKVRLHVSNIKEMDGQQLLHHLEDRFHLHYSRGIHHAKVLVLLARARR